MVEAGKLSSAQLMQLLEDRPWFTVARREAIARQGGDEEALRRAVGRDAVFFLSRYDIFRILAGKVPVVQEEMEEDSDRSTDARRQYYVVGGDYFGREDFDRLEKEGFSVTTPVFGQQAGATDVAPALQEEVDAGHVMVTETLARIYSDQELYRRSIDIYEKLILLYPEKSAYFAALIEKVKEKTQ